MEQSYKQNIKLVREKLSDRDLYELLAEELCEASQASLKYIRASKMNGNHTPTSELQSKQQLLEELGDVAMIVDLLQLDIPKSKTNNKWKRWADRLISPK